MNRLALHLSALLFAFAAGPVMAQNTVIQPENVRIVYAQVLRVSPVYQTLTATRVEQVCDQSQRADGDNSRLSRVVVAVKDALSRETPPASNNCRSVPVDREFRRPIAYDVDYTYRGAKYRSRLPEDPGNRLRIRIAVSPVIPGSRAP